MIIDLNKEERIYFQSILLVLSSKDVSFDESPRCSKLLIFLQNFLFKDYQVDYLILKKLNRFLRQICIIAILVCPQASFSQKIRIMRKKGMRYQNFPSFIIFDIITYLSNQFQIFPTIFQFFKYLFMRQMPLLLIFVSLLFSVYCYPPLQDSSSSEDTPVEQEEFFYKIGDSINGKIKKADYGSSLHSFQIQKRIKKYVFMRILTNSVIPNLRIRVFAYEDGHTISECVVHSSDSCFIKFSDIKDSQKIYIYVSGDNQAPYLLQTYWGNLEHLTPGQKIRFMFAPEDPTQLFHLQVNDTQFKQLRVLLRPETYKPTLDNVKIYANFGTQVEPTEEHHDLQSSRVWDDSQALFVSQEQLQNKEGLNLFVVGTSQTIYFLEAELLKDQIHEIKVKQVVHQFMKSHSEHKYRIDLAPITSDSLESLALKLSVFTGQVSFTLYKDQNLSNQIFMPPLQYMSDFQFHFTPQGYKFLGQDTIYLQVKSQDTTATFSIRLDTYQSQVATQMTEGIYQFISVKDSSSALFYSYKVMNALKNEEQINITLNQIVTTGNPDIRYYVCTNQQYQNCLKIRSEVFSNSTQEVKPISSQDIGEQSIKKFKIPKNLLYTYGGMINLLFVVVVSTGEVGLETKFAIGAFKIANYDKIETLRDERSVSDKILKGQVKFYQYSNLDPKIRSVQIFLSEMSGKTKVTTYRTDPRFLEDIEHEASSQLAFTENLTSPIYIMVEGILNSIYSISVGISHPDHPFTTALTLQQDIEYDVKIQPFSMMNIQIHPIGYEVEFEFKTEGGNVRLCQLREQSSVQCIQQSEYTGEEGSIQLHLNTTLRTIKFRIMNYPTLFINKTLNNLGDEKAIVPRTVRIKMIYHETEKMHCDMRRVNQVYREVLNAQKCLTFAVHSLGNIEIMKKVSLLDRVSFKYYLCGNIFIPSISSSKGRQLIKSKQIPDYCSSQNDITFSIQFEQSAISEDFKLEYSVEITDFAVYLMDGVTYEGRGKSRGEQSLKRFLYKIDQKEDIEIVLTSLKGKQKFVAFLTTEKEINLNKSSTHTLQAKKFKSEDQDHSLNPRIVILQKQMESQKCQSSCILAIDILTMSEPTQNVQYTITVFQNSQHLLEDETQQDYVAQNQFRYYEFVKTKKSGSLVVKVSDNNQDCAKIYLSEFQFPSSQTSFMEDFGTLIYENAPPKRYYIGVLGLADCLYSITASESGSKIIKLQSGHFYDIALSENQTKSILYRHYSKQGFKVISLLNYGSVQIGARTLSYSQLNFENDEHYGGQTLKSSYLNVLNVHPSDDQFCESCYYLIHVTAQEKLQGAIAIESENSNIKLTGDKSLFDELLENTTMEIERLPAKSGNLSVSVVYGSLKIEVLYHNKILITSQLVADKKRYLMDYRLEAEAGDSDPILIRIRTTNKSSLYSLQIMDQSQKPRGLNPGTFQEETLTQNKQVCVVGIIRSKQDEIIITKSNQNEQIHNILYQIQVIGTKDSTSFVALYYSNIIQLTYVSHSLFFTNPIPFTLCLTTNSSQDLPITIYQNSKINILPPNTQVIVKSKQQFIIHSKQFILVDIFECQGQAKIKYSGKGERASSKKSSTLDYLGIPNQKHAIRLSNSEESSFLALEVTVPEATMRWMPIDYEKEEGVGYFVYSAGSISFESEVTELLFRISRLERVKESKTVIKKINYIIYISESLENLERETNCQKFDEQKDKNILKINEEKGGNDVSQEIYLTVPKNDLKKHFQHQKVIFFKVVADLILETPSGNKQYYRFFYTQQELPTSLFMSLSYYTQLLINSGIFIGILLLFAITILLLCRCILPKVGRLKKREVVQFEGSIDGHEIEAGASGSERQRIEQEEGQETEQRMK